MNKLSRGGLVYSTEEGRMCPACRHAAIACVCAATAPTWTGDGRARIVRDTKGRGGKAVTVVGGLHLEAAALQSLCKALKTTCGVGGTVKGGAIELQGDHVDKVRQQLQRLGHPVRD
jgi:translation initiation factor 1